jgi:hypothetical protein
MIRGPRSGLEAMTAITEMAFFANVPGVPGRVKYAPASIRETSDHD